MTSWYVATDGDSGNTGSVDSPWDIESALLGHNGDIQPGDTIWLRGGTYYHPDRSAMATGYGFNLIGTSEEPIMVRAYLGERATIDGGMHTSGVPQHVRIQGLEVIVSEHLADESRVSSLPTAAGYEEFNRPRGGINFDDGADVKFINNVIHACAKGFGFSKSVSGGSELYGNIVYDNGWIGSDREHGTAIYAQNDSGDWKYIQDNIVFDNYSTIMQIYGSATAPLDDFYVARNIWFVERDLSGRSHAVRIGGGLVASRWRVIDNIGYDVGCTVGYGDEGADDVVVTGHYAHMGIIEIKNCTNLTASNNWMWWNGPPPWPSPRLDGVPIDIPTEPGVFLNPNAYDPNRANLAIINYTGLSEVQVNVASFLEIGDTFRFMDPADFFGQPVVEGIYTGSPISIPVAGEFAAFVLLKQGIPIMGSVNINVLANDTDLDGIIDPTSVVVVSPPVNGTVVVGIDGIVTYTPNEGYVGTDSFGYTVTDNDGATSNEATVSLNVVAPNVPPVAVDDGPVDVEGN